MSGGGPGSPGTRSSRWYQKEIERINKDYDRLVKDTSTIRHEHSWMRLEIKIKEDKISELEKELKNLRDKYEIKSDVST